MLHSDHDMNGHSSLKAIYILFDFYQLRFCNNYKTSRWNMFAHYAEGKVLELNIGAVVWNGLPNEIKINILIKMKLNKTF